MGDELVLWNDRDIDTGYQVLWSWVSVQWRFHLLLLPFGFAGSIALYAHCFLLVKH